MIELLAELNELRQADDKVPLKHWSGTEQELRYAIKKRRTAQMLAGCTKPSEVELVEEYLKNGGEVHQVKDASAKGVRRQGRQGKKFKKTQILITPSGKRVITPPGGRVPDLKIKDKPADTFLLVDLAAELGEDSRKTRMRARKSEELKELVVGTSGWLFKNSDRDRVGRLLWPKRWKSSDNLNP
jgi:hypothetical protein